jgi:hypothetical protein
VRLQPGGLHAQLPLLPHRHDALVRNLTPGEIVGQVMLARDALGEWPKGSMAGLEEDEDERTILPTGACSPTS